MFLSMLRVPAVSVVVLSTLFAGMLPSAVGQATAQGANKPKGEKEAVATLAGGCFWCTEAVFERMEGVNAVSYTHLTLPTKA